MTQTVNNIVHFFIISQTFLALFSCSSHGIVIQLLYISKFPVGRLLGNWVGGDLSKQTFFDFMS